MPRRARALSAPEWYCLVIGLFFLIRAGTTLLGGANFGLPGDGWRSLFQLAAVATLAAGLGWRRATAAAVAAVATVYALATLLELIHGGDLLGAIPVDSRDRFVHPLVALLGFACLAMARRAARRPVPAPNR
jgi:hypothetical protein